MAASGHWVAAGALKTLLQMGEGTGDLLRVGNEVGRVYAETADGGRSFDWRDDTIALSKDAGRAGGLALSLAVPASRLNARFASPKTVNVFKTVKSKKAYGAMIGATSGGIGSYWGTPENASFKEKAINTAFGIAAGAITGQIGGASLAVRSPIKTMLVGLLGGTTGASAGNFFGQLAVTGSVDYSQVRKAAIAGGVIGLLGGSVSGFLGTLLSFSPYMGGHALATEEALAGADAIGAFSEIATVFGINAYNENEEHNNYDRQNYR